MDLIGLVGEITGANRAKVLRLLYGTQQTRPKKHDCCHRLLASASTEERCMSPCF